MNNIFETERLIVRQFTKTDYANYFSLHGNAEVMQYIRPAKTRKECDALFDETILYAVPHPFMGRWAVEEKISGTFIGTFVIVPIPADEEKIQLGQSFIPAVWGKGFATELTIAGLAYFRDQTPLTEIYAVTETLNIASEKVLRKAGFQLFDKKMEGEKELQVFIVRRTD